MNNNQSFDDVRYLIASPAPEPEGTRLANLQQSHKTARWHISIEPHITVIAPGQARIAPSAAVRLFQELTLPSAAPIITLERLESFHTRNQTTLYLAPSPAGWLNQLHGTVLRAAGDW